MTCAWPALCDLPGCRSTIAVGQVVVHHYDIWLMGCYGSKGATDVDGAGHDGDIRLSIEVPYEAFQNHLVVVNHEHPDLRGAPVSDEITALWVSQQEAR